MSQYETQLTSVATSAKRVYEITKAGTIKENLPDYAYHLWNVQGYAQGLLIGQPTDLPTSLPSETIDGETREALASLSILAEPKMMQGIPDDAKAINLIQLFQLGMMVYRMLKELGIIKDRDEDVPAPEANPAG